MKEIHIAILMGGWNSEREVSLMSGEAVFESLKNLGYKKITKIDYSANIVEDLKNLKPDVVFNALHGRFGEDGTVQAILDVLQIPYTHSKVLASALCMDKILSKKLCSLVGVKSADYEILIKNDAENSKKIARIGKPFVIKPVNEGSSVGVEVILEDKKFDIANYQWEFGDQLIIEKYLAGQELQVAIINNKAIGVIEIKPEKLFYDYECKYTTGMTEYIMPAQIDAKKYQEVMDLALKCHKQTGCCGISRVDFILNNKNGGDNEFYFLEVNTQPGFTANSLVPKIAKHAGISFADIIEFLIKEALHK
jgi:D-alanine-D-alanine ligase